MPKPTFFNLPEAKRDRIVELAIEEFAAQPYAQASLSRIVARANIAKGSLYQYFDNKLDLYRWLLLEEVPRRKRAALTAGTRSIRPGDLPGLLRELVMSGLQFMLANPRLSALGFATTLPTTDPQLRSLYAEAQEGGHAGFRSLLEAARDRGELRDDVDPDLVARIVGSVLGYGLRSILRGRLGVDVQDLAHRPDLAESLTPADVRTVVDQTVRILIEGIGAR